MCTAISFKTKDHYFGRTLDFEHSYNEAITITPRNYPFKFRCVKDINTHYAIIGMATVRNNYPLYFDATNEMGLSMAGLYFLGNAYYTSKTKSKNNIASFEFIPWILSQCKNTDEAKSLLGKINITDTAFSNELSVSPLHWIISDKDKSLTIESVKDGVKIYENPVGVLTNNPTFDMQLFNLNNYMSLSKNSPINTFSEKLDLISYSRGMGALGLPGDFSSASRFVKASYIKLNSICGKSEEESVSQFFHILGTVEQIKGSVKLQNGMYENTIYTSCCNTDKGIYYYKTYENSTIRAVNMNNENLNSDKILQFSLIKKLQIVLEN